MKEFHGVVTVMLFRGFTERTLIQTSDFLEYHDIT